MDAFLLVGDFGLDWMGIPDRIPGLFGFQRQVGLDVVRVFGIDGFQLFCQIGMVGFDFID